MGNLSPQKSVVLDLHKKTGVELRESPSKSAKIAMKYINGYSDVGPIVASPSVTYSDLVDLGKTLDKKEVWVRSDLRLIFSVEDPQQVDESIEQLNNIIKNWENEENSMSSSQLMLLINFWFKILIYLTSV